MHQSSTTGPAIPARELATPWRAQHAAGVERFRLADQCAYGRRISSAIDMLLSRGVVTRCQHSAAQALLDDYEIMSGARPSREGPRGTGGSACWEDVRLQSGRHVAAVQRALGEQWPLVARIVLQGMSIGSAIGCSGGKKHRLAASMLRAALDEVAVHYRMA